ncbi:MAG TPA: TonB C-terminal domain-containing protein [Longimicrobiales bacterium]|nr:TonB C-terminal domain-containing protein [Longimicrobiales bacterium]
MSRRPDRRAIGISVLIHGIIVTPVVVFAHPPEVIEFETIRINLVSPPPTEAVEPAAPAQVAPQPEPEPERVRPEPEATVEEKPPETPPEKKVEEPRTEKPPATPPRQTTPSEPRPDAGGEGLNINTEGREFPYPEYLNNVIIQVHRYFRWSDESNPRGVVYFEILQDGSVRNIRMVRPSGNRRFDFAVQGAIETAANRGAFGPLPDGFAAPTLPVQLEVEPPR